MIIKFTFFKKRRFLMCMMHFGNPPYNFSWLIINLCARCHNFFSSPFQKENYEGEERKKVKGPCVYMRKEMKNDYCMTAI